MIINREIKKENAITLVSLVITIVVLLILAGVSISIIAGPDGLIQTTQKAAIETKKADIKERVELKLTNLNLGKIAQTQEGATLQDVLELKNSDNEIIDAYSDEDAVILVVDNYECKISKDLQVEILSEYNPTKLRKVQRDLTFCEFEEKE